jgi:hypothetical protein
MKELKKIDSRVLHVPPGSESLANYIVELSTQMGDLVDAVQELQDKCMQQVTVTNATGEPITIEMDSEGKWHVAEPRYSISELREKCEKFQDEYPTLSPPIFIEWLKDNP